MPRARTAHPSLTLLVAILAAAVPPVARGDEAASRRAELAAEFSDPLTTLPQVTFQDVYTPASYGTEAQANRLIARLLIPRVPRFAIFPFPQLIRPSFSLLTVPKGPGKGTTTEFGDIQIFDLAVLPGSSRERGLYMGLGPLFVFPTATSRTAGQGSWQVGPAFGSVYKGIPGFIFGCLIQNPVSFAYTESDRQAVNTLLFQPIAYAYLGRGFYVKSADSTWSHGWRRGGETMLPISLGVGYVRVSENAPPINVFVAGEWTAYRDNAPVAPQTSIRFGINVAFPELRPWD